MYPTYWKDEDGYINIADNEEEESMFANEYHMEEVSEGEYQAWQLEV